MKKIYALLLLTTIIFSTSCMEQQRKNFHNNCEGIFPAINPSNFIPVYITTIRPTVSMHTTYTYQPLPQHVVAHEPSWQQLDKIADIPYKRDQKSIHEVELTPIYYPIALNTNDTATTKKPIEPKPFLRTLTPVQPDADLMQKLYRNAHGAIWSTSTLPNKILTGFIDSMNTAKTNGINEDIMGKFAYNQIPWFLNNTPDQHISLLFSCLKQYRLTVSTTKELLPPNPSSIDYLAKAFGLYNMQPIISTQKPNAQLETSIQQTSEPYPAYHKLAASLTTLLKQDFRHVTNVCDYLYSEDKFTLCKQTSFGHYTHLNNDFYDKAYDLIAWCYVSSDYTVPANLDKIYDLLKIVNLAKHQGDLTEEKELGYAMLTHGPTVFLNFLIYTSQSSDYDETRTNRICLLCTLIEKYNKQKKVTPTSKQYICYQLQKKLDCALPDSFAQSNLLDEEEYAFAEFKQLIEDIILLQSSDQKKVQECVNQLYPARK